MTAGLASCWKETPIVLVSEHLLKLIIVNTRAYIEMQIASLRSLDRLDCSYMRRICSPEE